MANEFRPYSPGQIFLFPPSPADWLAEDHLAYQILDVVEELDKTAFLSAYSNYSKDGRGAPAFSPTMMVALLLYAWCRHVYSSRKIAALCLEDVGARLITAGNFPDFRSINTFRLRHGKALAALFEQSVSLCQRAGMVSLVNVAVDGSKLAANASKRKAMSYERMVDAEAKLQLEIEALTKAGVEGYFKQAAEEDAADERRYGAESAGSQLPEELRRREGRLAKIRAAKAALEAEAQAAAESKRKAREALEAERLASTGRKPGGKPPKIDPTPKPTAQRGFTDPDSRIMKIADGSFKQAYNGQAAVDGKNQVIVACTLSQQAADGDGAHLPVVIDQVIANTGATPKTVMSDGGYYSEENVKRMEALGIRVLIPPDGVRCGSPTDPAPPLSEEALSTLSMTERMRYLVSTEQGRKTYALRKAIVEPVFGQEKGCVGHPGFQGFLRRGLDKCTEEWKWVGARHNLMKYIRFQRFQQRARISCREAVG